MAEQRKAAEERMRGPAEMPNFGPPSTPRPAASTVLLRRGGRHAERALEVLMLKRSAEARFMPGVWVFPGGSVDPADGEGEGGCRTCAVRELHEEAGIELPAGEELVLFARWITPEVISTRFDARFYLALAPAHTPPEPDGNETVEARWFEPRAALEAADRGEIVLAFPTITQLGLLAEHPTSDAAIAAYRDAVVEPILPVVVGTREDARVLLPGDPEYPE
jgi:8-oxo-dGTP pyrophosphatase MutT (NUDIX family)